MNLSLVGHLIGFRVSSLPPLTFDKNDDEKESKFLHFQKFIVQSYMKAGIKKQKIILLLPDTRWFELSILLKY